MPIVDPNVSSLELLTNLLAWPGPEGPINRIQIERSATGGGIGFANIGSLTLTAGNLTPGPFFDTAGVSSDWYRWYFSNAANTFPVAGQRDYSPEVQPSAEGQGLLCSLGDVLQELDESGIDTNRDELILQKIGEVSWAMEDYTKRWLAPRPVVGTTTFRFHTEDGLSLFIKRGIRTITTLGIATTDQPTSGGTYTTASATTYYIDPPVIERMSTTEPGYWIRLIPTVAAARFVDATFGAEVNGSYGPASVRPDIRGIAIRASIRRFIGKGAGGPAVAVGPGGGEFILPDMSGADRKVLESLRFRTIG